MGAALQITLNSGRHIRLEELIQYRTYAGLLAGFPNRRLNRQRVERALERARDSLRGPPFLIEPVAKESGAPAGDDECRVDLPGIVCLAMFRSPEPARDAEQVYSFLTVVWFQDEWALPIDPGTTTHIQAVDWHTLATDATD